MQYPNGHTVTMQYDGDGQMTGVTDWLGNTTQFQYDHAEEPRVRMHASPIDLAAGRRYDHDLGLRRGRPDPHIQARDAIRKPVCHASTTPARATGGSRASTSTGLGDPDHSYAYGIQARLGSYDGAPVTFDSRNNVTRLPDGSTLSYDAGDQLTSGLCGGLHRLLHLRRRRPADRLVVGRTIAELRLERRRRSVVVHRPTARPPRYTVNGDGQRVSSSRRRSLALVRVGYGAASTAVRHRCLV